MTRSIKHCVHIDRVALGQAVHVWLEANQGKRNRPPWKKTALAIGISVRRCIRARAYYQQHADEPRIPEMGHLRHADVVKLGFKGVATIRETLVRNFSATIGLAKPAYEMSNADIKRLAAACGLETFLHRGRRLIHWKHSAQPAS
jgi:hypothetical protein